jgi:hypothetical protein
MSEDLGHRDSTVRPTASGSVELNWRRTNMRAHHRFVDTAKRLLKDIGFPVVLSKLGTDTPSPIAAARFGTDPPRPLDPSAARGTTTICMSSTQVFSLPPRRSIRR